MTAFAKANGFEIVGTHPNRTLLDVRASVENIEGALHLRMNRYAHPTENRSFFAPESEPSLDLTVPVLYIAGLSDFAKPHPASSRFHARRPGPEGQSARHGFGSRRRLSWQ